MAEIINFSEKLLRKSEEYLKLVGIYIRIAHIKAHEKKVLFDISKKYKDFGKEIYLNKLKGIEKVEVSTEEPAIKSITSVIEKMEEKLEKLNEEMENLKDKISEIKENRDENEGEI